MTCIGQGDFAIFISMHLALILFILVAALELLLYGPFWTMRRWYSLAALLATALATSYLLVNYFNFGTWLILFFSLYRIINLVRVQRERIEPKHLRNSARQASAWLVFFQLVILVLALDHVGLVLGWLYGLAVAQLLAALIILAASRHNVHKMQPPKFKSYAEKDLPALTVAIPARNETEELDECLDSLVRSSYPKLEIIVLDDCSQNKRTPEIIKSFAQAGVRFVPGEVPPERWLAKNYAYKQLAASANGELILFCGTDVRFVPDSLAKLVETMLTKQKDMLCLMPANIKQKGIRSLFIQPARYAWEIALPRRLLGRPPVLSTCWLIKADKLRDWGGFEAASRKMIPESYLARRAIADNDGYAFLVSNKELGFSSKKAFNDQRDTAIRTRYPQLHRRIEWVAVISLIQAYVLVWPSVSTVLAIFIGQAGLAVVSAVGFIIIAFNQFYITSLTYRQTLPGSLLLLPVTALYDLTLLNYSMWRYEFDEVIWKGRNVCVPVMRQPT